MPLIARWDGRIPAGKVTGKTISQVDFYATFAAVAGVKLKPNEALDSFDIIDAMLHPSSRKKVRQVGIHTTGLRSARLDHFKAIADRDGNFIEMYDLRSDIGETKNLIGLPEYAKQEKALRKFLNKSREDGRTRPRLKSR